MTSDTALQWADLMTSSTYPNGPTTDVIAALAAEVRRLRGLHNTGRLDVMWQEMVLELDKAKKDLASARAEAARLREALSSIARNTCCDRCQEAALVAKAALEPR